MPVEMTGGEPGCQYYDQLHYNNMWLKVGDCVYIQSHELIKPRIGRYVNQTFYYFSSCVLCVCERLFSLILASSRCLLKMY